MQKQVRKLIILALAAALLLSACGPSEDELKATAAAQTLEVISVKETAVMDTLIRLTQTEAAKPPTATQTPLPTNTPQPTVTLAGLATSTAVPQTASGGTSALASETVPDGTIISPGTNFTKTWKLRNTGTATWSTGYALAFVSGDQLGAPAKVYLTVPVPPGNLVDVSVAMTAPPVTGSYKGNWRLQDAAGQWLGATIWVQIVSGAAPTGTGTQTTITVTPTGPTPTATATATLDPNFKVTAVDIIESDIRTSVTGLACDNLTPFYLANVSANITADRAGVATYYWKFGNAAQAVQTVTFSSSSTQRTLPVNSPEYTAAPGLGIEISLIVTSPNAIQDTYKWNITCH